MDKAKKRKLPPAGAGFALALLLAALPGILLAAVGDIYRNDFSTRTSVLPLPGDRWMSYTYDPNTLLYYNYGGAASSYSMWELNEQYQDAWGKAWMDDATMEKSPGFALATDPVHGSPGNYFALFRSSTSRSGCAIQPLHNEFTNGMLRLEVDIRRPAVWGSQAVETHAARVALIYRKRMADPLWWVGINSTDYPVMFGAHWEGGANNKDRLVLHYRNGSDQQKTLEPGVSGDDYVCNENWYRWRVYVNLDEQRSNCYIWDAGPDQPDGRNTLADTTATRKVEATGYFFRNPMTDETGGISGIALNSYRCFSGTGDNLAVTNAPCFDNIHIAWKAPGSSEYVPFYENDFTTRRYRRIQPTPAAAVDYPVGTAISKEDNFTSYSVVTNREDTSPTLMVNSTPGLLGMDNWTRLLNGGKFCVIDSNTDGKNELRVSDGGNGIVAQTLGETITSGKVRISADVRLPTEWNLTSGQTDARVCLVLGGPNFWSLSDPGGYTGRYAGYGAIVGESKDEFRPAHIRPGATLVSTKSADVACTPKTWYRMVVTADLGSKTYDYELYELGTYAGPIDRADVPSTPVYATNSIPFRNNISSIGSFGLYSYRPGTDWNNYILWDNFQVWKDWDSSAGTGTLVYANDFNTRTRYLTREKTELVHGVNTGVGVDSWEQVNRRDGIAWVVGGANRFLSLKVPNSGSFYMTQPLPFEVPNGQRVTLRADVRPPSCWYQSGSNLNIYLGGDEMCQYARPSVNPFADSVMMFGLNAKSNVGASLGRYTNTVFRAQNGNEFPWIDSVFVKPDHWYRMEGTTLSGSDNWKLRVYDMGTAHPEIDAPTGPLVATLDGLARRGSGATSGISALAISSGGFSSRDPWDPYDPGRVLLDNLVVTVIPAGTYIIVR